MILPPLVFPAFSIKTQNNGPHCNIQHDGIQHYKRIRNSALYYTITIIHRLSIYTSMIHSLHSLKLLALVLNSLDPLSDVRIKVFMLPF
jgi:hypothetical protein